MIKVLIGTAMFLLGLGAIAVLMMIHPAQAQEGTNYYPSPRPFASPTSDIPHFTPDTPTPIAQITPNLKRATATPRPSPTPNGGLAGCWIWAPQWGILQQCDLLPPRPLEPPIGSGSMGTLPRPDDFQVFLPLIQVCAPLKITLDGEGAVTISNRTCDVVDLLGWRIVNGPRSCQLAGIVKPNQSWRVTGSLCGYGPTFWPGDDPVKVYDNQGVEL